MPLLLIIPALLLPTVQQAQHLILSYCICMIGFYCNQMTHRLWVLSKICRKVPLLDPTMIPMKFERNPSLMKNAFSAFNLYFHFVIEMSISNS